MNVDVDQLTEAELRELNHKIVARLRLLQQMRAHAKMLEFKIGDRVSFQGNYGEVVTGMITRYNKKSVSVIADSGHRWTVSPSLLRLADSFSQTPNASQQNRQ